jgi:hypothetical protein
MVCLRGMKSTYLISNQLSCKFGITQVSTPYTKDVLWGTTRGVDEQ